MKQENYILNVINDIKTVLEKNDYTKKRYEHDLKWLKEREIQTINNTVRIAIMGITSSGKSTLVNAIIGESLLPIAIKPSSSIIITCSKSNKRQAVIYFRDKEPIIIEGEDLNSDAIRMYADESENPDNKLNVSQIDINSPGFLLGDNIHIIDSPGLDACDLEIHEKITMEILLPTIDICVFLTTVKANSDEINVEKIRVVNEKNKEIILAQNMIDSVEPKIGKNGIIEEDKDVILNKHKKRAENLLRVGTKTEADEDKNFNVIQISALNAYKGIVHKNSKLYEESNMDEFVREIKKCVCRVMPKINNARSVSLKGKIDNIIATDKRLMNESADTYISSVNKENIDDTFKEFKFLKGDILTKIGSLDNIISEIISQINTSDEKEIESCNKIIEAVNNHNSEIENEILSVVKKCENNKSDIYKKLNLDERYSYSIPSMTYDSVKLKRKYVPKKKLVEKHGVFNRGKRLLSNVFDKSWGYEEKTQDEIIIDKESTIIELQNVCNVNRVKYINIINEWSKQYVRSINLFYNEVSRREKEFINKKSQDINVSLVKPVHDELVKIIDSIIAHGKIDVNEAAVTLIEEYNNKTLEDKQVHNVKTDCTKNSYNVYKIVNNIIEKNYLAVGSYIHKKSCSVLNDDTKEIFWTWDLNVCASFISRVCGIFLKADEIAEIKKSGIFKYKEIIVVYEDGINKIKLYENLKYHYGFNYNLYIIFNGIQIGNSKKHILKNLALKDFVVNNKVMTNLVIDSSIEFIHGNNMKELLTEVNSLKEEFKEICRADNIGYILINSKNPIYNITLIESQERKKFIISDYKDIKERVFKNMLSKGSEEKETIEDILTYYLDYNLY
ncbi:MAG: dynamin family protein [Clostridium sp.]|nr:dynamin family protein [Clostridium sp.]